MDGAPQILGHSGRRYWMWTKRDGVVIFMDPVRQKTDFDAVDERRRLLRLALRVFFLGNLADGPAAITLKPDEELAVPQGNGEAPVKVLCHRLDRAALPADGEPALRLYLDAKSLRPVAALLLAADPAGPSSLLTFAYDEKSARKPEMVPPGVRVPDAVELFEVAPGEGAKPEIRIQAEVFSLVIDSKPHDDAEFAPAAPPPK